MFSADIPLTLSRMDTAFLFFVFFCIFFLLCFVLFVFCVRWRVGAYANTEDQVQGLHCLLTETPMQSKDENILQKSLKLQMDSFK